MAFVVHTLRDTVAGRWRRELAGPEPSVRKHWLTKVSYYWAAERLLAGGRTDDQTTWGEIVAEVRPQGTRTTFFAVAGRHAKHPLLRAYQSAPAGPVRDVAACLDHESAAQMLIAESKVWSHWPHRMGWVQELLHTDGLSRTAVADCLLRVLLDWAGRHPALSAALDHAPPASAVEDLLMIQEHRISAAAAARILREALLRSAAGCSIDGVVHAMRAHFRPAPAPAAGNQRLAQAIDQLTRNQRASYEQRRHAVALMRDAIRQLEAGQPLPVFDQLNPGPHPYSANQAAGSHTSSPEAGNTRPETAGSPGHTNLPRPRAGGAPATNGPPSLPTGGRPNGTRER
ncbi:hypothetical protein [Actinoplanes utahensis]|uniref:hypothetical protein n=1 Tax=Actinoplanes utahensis TaxID=1869 RepID=UPI00068D3839|nr:hypothetical protein [Actinoplanes utahensis]GIF32831.1 hypothetical protein Aut01nite_58170 [Actinoplanes utahensis]